ncbi:MAG TPA: transglycosylase domain-containing protein [Chloroflexota bacterium]
MDSNVSQLVAWVRATWNIALGLVATAAVRVAVVAWWLVSYLALLAYLIVTYVVLAIVLIVSYVLRVAPPLLRRWWVSSKPYLGRGRQSTRNLVAQVAASSGSLLATFGLALFGLTSWLGRGLLWLVMSLGGVLVNLVDQLVLGFAWILANGVSSAKRFIIWFALSPIRLIQLVASAPSYFSLRRLSAGLLATSAAGALIAVVGVSAAGATALTAVSVLMPSPSLTDVAPGGIQVFDRNGELLYEFAGGSGGFRRPVSLDQISPNLINATIATEDADFYSNPGINFRGLIRAVYENLAFWRYGGVLQGTGGSSITQQVVKMITFPNQTPVRSPAVKLHEVTGALAVARDHSKDEVLSWYLNSLFYGSGAYGAEAAAQRYFGKPANDLSLPEASFLAGIPNAPGFYNVDDNLDAVYTRQREVLDLMVLHGYISADEADAAYAEDLDFKSADFEIQAPYFVMYVRDLLPKLVDESALRHGLKVTTTLDLGLQQTAEQDVSARLASLPRSMGPLEGALIAIDPRNAQVLAMVGGHSFFEDPVRGQINYALAPNSPGSAMKPITYLAAFEKGWSPATIIPDQPIQLNNGVRPYTLQNFDGKYSGRVSARDALGNSLNVPAVHALQFAGLDVVYNLAGRMGLTTLEDISYYGPAFTLGGADVRLLDLAYAYTVLANGGEQRGMKSIAEPRFAPRALDPSPILKIDDAQGHSLWEYQPQAIRVAPAAETYLITNVLSDNNARLRTFAANNPETLPDRPVAAKTGLSEAPSDAWTLGYTPQLVTGVWVGNPTHAAIPGGTSSLLAGPLWQKFMMDALAGEPALPFDPPAGVEFRPTCKLTGLPADGRCSPVVQEVFVAGRAAVADGLGSSATQPPPVAPAPRPAPAPAPKAPPGKKH